MLPIPSSVMDRIPSCCSSLQCLAQCNGAGSEAACHGGGVYHSAQQAMPIVCSTNSQSSRGRRDHKGAQLVTTSPLEGPKQGGIASLEHRRG